MNPKKQIYQLKISLKYIKPQIWRRILVKGNTDLRKLHQIVNSAMGWEDCHLHKFKIGNDCYGNSSMDGMNYLLDERKFAISDIFRREKQKITYEYDFGDGWEHQIVFERMLPFKENEEYPRCIAGKMACPPEDCGGFPGYMQLVEIVSNPEHPEYKDMIEWLGDDFDPDIFSLQEANKRIG